MESKIDIRTEVYMIKNNKDKYILPVAYETKGFAEFIMEVKFNSLWIHNNWVEVIVIPVKFLKETY